MLKHLKVSFFILLLALPLFVCGIYLNNSRIHALSKGNYFFEATRDHPHIASIIIKFNNNKTITLKRQNQLWRALEADGYLVSFAKINTLISLIRNTIIYRTDKLKKDEIPFDKKNSITIQSVDNSGNIVESAIIALKNKNNKHHYALLNNDGFLYQISENYNLNPNVLDWLQSPILKIHEKEIKEIKNDKFYVSRRFKNDIFTSNIDDNDNIFLLPNLIDHLWFLSAIDVKHSTNFKLNDYKKVKFYEILLFNGIIYKLSLYLSNTNEYWLHVKLDKNTLMSKDGIKWLDENNILYDGWFFKIPKEKGILLSRFEI